MENWKDVVGFEGIYQVSDHGRVKSLCRMVRSKGGAMRLSRGKILSQGIDSGGYMNVTPYSKGIGKTAKVHSLVLEAFAGPCPLGMECCHRNSVRHDNRFANLRWGTRSSNMLDKELVGTAPIGDSNPKAKLSNVSVLEICSRLSTGESQMKIADDFGVSEVTISHIACGRTWVHITGIEYVRERASVTTDLNFKIAKLKMEGRSLNQIVDELGISRSTAFRHGKSATVSGATERGF